MTQDKTKQKMIEEAKKQILKQMEDPEYASVEIINIYDDKSGLASLKYGSCSCCSEYVFSDTMQENIREHFTVEDQLEVAQYFVHLLMDKYKMIGPEKISSEIYNHLNKIINYNWLDEKKHYEEIEGAKDLGIETDSHIFMSLKAVKEWMEQ